MQKNNQVTIRFTTVALAFLSLSLSSLAVASGDGYRRGTSSGHPGLDCLLDIDKVVLSLAPAQDIAWPAPSDRDREERDRTERESTAAPAVPSHTPAPSTRSSRHESRRAPHQELWDARQLRDFIETFADRPELTCGSISLSFPTAEAKDRRVIVTFKYPEEVRQHLIETEVKRRLAEEEAKRHLAEEEVRKQQIQKKLQELTYLQSTTRFVCKWVPPLCFAYATYKIATSSFVTGSVSGLLKGARSPCK